MKPLLLIFGLVLAGCTGEQSAEQVAASYCKICEPNTADLCVAELMSRYEDATVCDSDEPCISCGLEWTSAYACRLSAGCAERPPECQAAREALGDCEAERSGLSIVAILARDDSCEVDADSSDQLDRGLYDLAYPAAYLISVLLQSSLVSDGEHPEVEPASLLIDSFEIAFLLPDGTPVDLPGGLYTPFRVATSVVLDANETRGDVTREVGAAIGIPVSYKDALKQAVLGGGGSTVVLEIFASGTTLGGVSKRSPRFRWSVDLCEGCLESCPSQGGQSCQPGQDGDTYCAQ